MPDLLTRKMAGLPLVERVLDTARACAPAQDICLLTDKEEIALIAERAGLKHILISGQRSQNGRIEADIQACIASQQQAYRHCVLLGAACPLLTWVDVENAWKKYLRTGVDALVAVQKVRQRIWQPHAARREDFCIFPFFGAKKTYVLESGALAIFNMRLLGKRQDHRPPRTIPFFLQERGLEIQDYQDWWICERLLERRHVVFVVAGYPAIGMGHVYRTLMLAHEISSHKITFVCTRKSELAVESVASRDYHVVRQGDEDLAETVLAQLPDLVINDFLNTDAAYIATLQKHGARCVNFEDEGSGARVANLVINALYESDHCAANMRCGPDYFCLRDEFLYATRNPLRPWVQTLLLTFGGTDQHNSTLRVLNIVEPICRAYGIGIRIVTGPGYAHKAALEERLRQLENPRIWFSWATNIMSKMMEGADLAICSAGRTVYELAHMRVPGIVLASHEREARHSFARPRNGFAFAGVATAIPDNRIRNLFLAMLKQRRRALYWERQNRLSFAANKEKVVGLLEDQLEKAEKA